MMVSAHDLWKAQPNSLCVLLDIATPGQIESLMAALTNKHGSSIEADRAGPVVAAINSQSPKDMYQVRLDVRITIRDALTALLTGNIHDVPGPIYPFCPNCKQFDNEALKLNEESVYDCSHCGETYMAINNNGIFEFDAFVGS